MRAAALLLLAACAAPRAAGPATPPPVAGSLAWFAGHWSMERPGGRFEELWLAPSGGTLYGVSRGVSEGETVFFEFLAVEPREGADGPTLVYVARPRGGAPVDFLLVELGPRHATFANPANDFPRRIRYELRADGVLHARIDDGTDAGTGEDFLLRRAE